MKIKRQMKGMFTVSIASVIMICVTTISAIVIGSRGDSNLFDAQADTLSPYTVTLDSTHNTLSPSSSLVEGYIRTASDYSIKVGYSKFGSRINAWGELGTDGLFYNIDPINKLDTISLTLKENSSLTVWYGFTSHVDTYIETFTSVSSITCDFNGVEPSHFTIIANSTSNITNVTINYSCGELKTQDIIQFGSYPQTKVTDSTLVSTLTGMSGDLPAASDSKSWTSYNYFMNSSNVTDYMWYQDITIETGVNAGKYRGVYFLSYRPYDTRNPSSALFSYQDDNNYYLDNVYWFEYEPIS